MKARALLSSDSSDLVSQASANLLFKCLDLTKAEILAKYPHFDANKENIFHKSKVEDPAVDKEQSNGENSKPTSD